MEDLTAQGALMLCMALYGALMGSLSGRILSQWPAPPHPLCPAHGCPMIGYPVGAIANRPAFALRYGCEASCALLFILVGLAAGTPAGGLPVALLFSWFLCTLCWIDYYLLLLPDKLTVPFLLCGLASHIPHGGAMSLWYEGLPGALAGGASLWILNWVFYGLRGYRGMGGGDIKLLAALGAWLGWQVLPRLCCEAALSGLAFYAISGRTKGKIAFGPCLALAGWVNYISP